MSFISVQDVHKSFGSQRVLRGVNLDFQRGQTVVIIGESGTGKSVLLKHIIGLLNPDKGKVLMEDREIGAMTESEKTKMRTRFGMLFQGAALFDSLNVFENVSFPLREHTKMTEKEMLKITKEKLAMVGMSGVEYKYPSELSGGMKKRVGLARAIVLNPEVILYDEPTTGLDPIMSDVINNLIVDMKTKVGAAGIAVTHDMVSARKIADRIVMLFEGKIIYDGTPDDIVRTDNAIVRQFVEGRAEGPITTARNNRELGTEV